MKKITLLFTLLIGCQFSFAQKKISLDDIYGKGTFATSAVSGFRSMADGKSYSNTFSEKDAIHILKYDFATGKVTDTILNGSTLVFNGKQLQFSGYSFSADEKKILLETEVETVYRHSTRAKYFVYDRTTRNVTELAGGDKQMYAGFSPEGLKVAFVRNNNLYIKDLSTGDEKAVTDDGKINSVINGATDWVYEEEFSMDKGYEWNGDGSSIAYYRFDETAVKEFNLTYYGGLYPNEVKFKYPKAGEENSKVDIYVYHLTTGRSVKMETGEKEYLPRMKWSMDKDRLSIQTMNRNQNVLKLLLCNAETGKATVLLHEENNSFIEITDDLKFLNNGRQFIWTSSSSGYNHLYLYNMNGRLEKQITKGEYDIMNYYGFNEKSGEFFFQSAEPTPMERSIYKCDLKGKRKRISPENGTSSATFTADYSYFVCTHSSYGSPSKSFLSDNSGKEIRVLQANEKAREKLKDYHISQIETLKVNNGQGTELNGWMIKPPDFTPSKKYPVLFFVYGGPGKQTVVNAWGGNDYLFHQMLAQKQYIIVSFDNRGTKGRGLEFANSIHKNLGKLEVEDQLAMARHIKQLPYVDADRIGVWGWSYGGYMTSLLLTKGDGLFRCGIAVAPVTNWRFYDSIYTERYLQTPAENASGYDENSPINFAASLKGKFLLVHGSTDDNVHMQNTMEFVTALVNAKKPFDLFIYPNKAHGISGTATRYHLFDKITTFIETNL